jgi:hypothetical protein
VWAVADGAYAKRPFVQPVMKQGVTLVGRLRKDSALRDLPPAEKVKRRGRKRKYGVNRISLIKRAAHPQGWQEVTCVAYGAEVVKRVKTFLATHRTFGGAIRVGGGGDADVIVTSSTFAGNISEDGAAFRNDGGTLTLRNSIVAGDGAQCSGSAESQGFNLGTDDTCGLDDAFDQPDTDPILDDLADNGGATRTHALLPGSPAIESGLPADDPACLGTTDQRGVPRPQGHACDVGAYERSVEADGPDDPIDPVDPDPVVPIEDQVADLIATVEDTDVRRQAQLTTALESVLHHLAADRVSQACDALARFDRHVHRQSGQRDGLTEEQAHQLLRAAGAVKDELGC